MRYLIALFLLGFAPLATAQNISGVTGPVVKDGHESAQYRTGYDLDSERFAHRLHYQKSINGDLRWRAVIAARETDDSDFDFNYVQAELLWELSDDNDTWKRALRFDARIRGDGRPGLFAAQWANEFPVSDAWTARISALSSVDIGDDARDGISLQTRGQIYTKIGSGQKVGLELFNAYGSTDDIPDFEDQKHTLGPFVSFPVNDDWSLFTGVQIGLTEASSDRQLRLQITRGF